MKKNNRVPFVSMTEERQKQEKEKLKMSVKYNMFAIFEDDCHIDDKIVDLPDDTFSEMTEQFSNRIEYFDAVTQAEKYVLKGAEIPEDLENKISITRQDYGRYVCGGRSTIPHQKKGETTK